MGKNCRKLSKAGSQYRGQPRSLYTRTLNLDVRLPLNRIRGNTSIYGIFESYLIVVINKFLQHLMGMLRQHRVYTGAGRNVISDSDCAATDMLHTVSRKSII